MAPKKSHQWRATALKQPKSTAHKETLAEFLARGGVIQKIDVGRPPDPDTEAIGFGPPRHTLEEGCSQTSKWEKSN